MNHNDIIVLVDNALKNSDINQKKINDTAIENLVVFTKLSAAEQHSTSFQLCASMSAIHRNSFMRLPREEQNLDSLNQIVNTTPEALSIFNQLIPEEQNLTILAKIQNIDLNYEHINLEKLPMHMQTFETLEKLSRFSKKINYEIEMFAPLLADSRQDIEALLKLEPRQWQTLSVIVFKFIAHAIRYNNGDIVPEQLDIYHRAMAIIPTLSDTSLNVFCKSANISRINLLSTLEDFQREEVKHREIKKSAPFALKNTSITQQEIDEINPENLEVFMQLSTEAQSRENFEKCASMDSTQCKSFMKLPKIEQKFEELMKILDTPHHVLCHFNNLLPAEQNSSTFDKIKCFEFDHRCTILDFYLYLYNFPMNMRTIETLEKLALLSKKISSRIENCATLLADSQQDLETLLKLRPTQMKALSVIVDSSFVKRYATIYENGERVPEEQVLYHRAMEIIQTLSDNSISELCNSIYFDDIYDIDKVLSKLEHLQRQEEKQEQGSSAEKTSFVETYTNETRRVQETPINKGR